MYIMTTIPIATRMMIAISMTGIMAPTRAAVLLLPDGDSVTFVGMSAGVVGLVSGGCVTGPVRESKIQVICISMTNNVH